MPNYSGYAAGPWWQGYPVNYTVANNYVAMSQAAATDGDGAPAADTSAGDTAADAGFGG